MTDLIRPDDVTVDKATVVAASFLAAYRGKTRELYTTNLKLWFRWCERHAISPLDVSRAHIEVWARELEEREGNKLATVANKLNTVCRFYRMAKIDRHIVDNPAEYIRKPSIPRVSTTIGLSRSELLRCLDKAQQTDPQDHALWCVLAFNGLRVGEAMALDVEHLGRVGGYRTIRVTREKGNRDADIPMAPRTSWAIDTMLGSREAGPLFRKRPLGERMDQKAANRIVHRIVKAAGIDKRITPHSLRHTHITLALNAGVPVRDVVNSMGYADARQVSYYDRDKDSLSRNATHMVSAFVEGA